MNYWNILTIMLYRRRSLFKNKGRLVKANSFESKNPTYDSGQVTGKSTPELFRAGHWSLLIGPVTQKTSCFEFIWSPNFFTKCWLPPNDAIFNSSSLFQLTNKERWQELQRKSHSSSKRATSHKNSDTN